MRVKAAIFLCILGLGYGDLGAQHYSLYNSGTLAESVENPWVSVFEGTCKKVASNFFIPTVNGDGFLEGDAAEGGRESLFWGRGMQDTLSGWQRRNQMDLYGHVNVLSVKYLLHEATNTELLFDLSMRSMNAATVKNLTVNLAQGGDFITQSEYGPGAGPVNSNAFHYLFNETSLGLRRRFDETFAAGIKLSYLSGIAHFEGGVGYSEGEYGRTEDLMILRMRGQAEFTPYPGDPKAGDFLPGFRNPGFSISGGVEKRVGESFKFTVGIKDLGSIRWKQKGERVLLTPEDEVLLENFSVLS
ncbi:MAG TPA: DUF5723 family protein, partial [Anseongella sp.]|nr:DUF5723 family protein [Anseongella sp.]